MRKRSEHVWRVINKSESDGRVEPWAIVKNPLAKSVHICLAKNRTNRKQIQRHQLKEILNFGFNFSSASVASVASVASWPLTPLLRLRHPKNRMQQLTDTFFVFIIPFEINTNGFRMFIASRRTGHHGYWLVVFVSSPPPSPFRRNLNKSSCAWCLNKFQYYSNSNMTRPTIYRKSTASEVFSYALGVCVCVCVLPIFCVGMCHINVYFSTTEANK